MGRDPQERRHGRGEAAPIPRYDESAQSALAYAEEAAGALGDDPFALEEIMARLPAREFAARAAIDGALHDLQGKLVGRPVYQLLGLAARRAADLVDDLARRSRRHGAARGAVRGRFKRLKLKIGGRDGHDVDRVRAVREVADVPLQVDVNEAWARTRRSTPCRSSRSSASSTASSRSRQAIRDGAER